MLEKKPDRIDPVELAAKGRGTNPFLPLHHLKPACHFIQAQLFPACAWSTTLGLPATPFSASGLQTYSPLPRRSTTPSSTVSSYSSSQVPFSLLAVFLTLFKGIDLTSSLYWVESDGLHIESQVTLEDFVFMGKPEDLNAYLNMIKIAVKELRDLQTRFTLGLGVIDKQGTVLFQNSFSSQVCGHWSRCLSRERQGQLTSLWTDQKRISPHLCLVFTPLTFL